MENFNQLTPEETERLAILMEECAEVQQIIGKILRHGYESYNPNDKNKKTNRSLLEEEIGDLTYIVNLCMDKEDINGLNIMRLASEKKISEKYLHHN